MIPRVIHCCWIGDAPKGALAAKCRMSWSVHALDFEVREWNLASVESEGVAVPPFVRQALAARKWAFAADWLRFLALYRDGGVYLDYDVELIGPMDDLVARGEFVNGHWLPDGSVGAEGAVMALERNSPVARAMLDYYETATFGADTTVGEVLAARLPACGIPLAILPPEVFSPIDVRGTVRQTAETRGIHRYAMSWASPGRRMARWLSWHGMRGVVEKLLKVRRMLNLLEADGVILHVGGIGRPNKEKEDSIEK